MLISFHDGRAFATGAATFLANPEIERESAFRLLIPVEIEGLQTMAILDTGAPYGICAPYIAEELLLHPSASLARERILFRGYTLDGSLYRLNLTLRAERGASLSVEATVFVPDETFGESWGTLPSFLGLTGCLERFRFAIDPADNIFYFGALEN